MAAARKFSAEEYVSSYIEECMEPKDPRTGLPMIPMTYQGHRLPQWLIKVILLASWPADLLASWPSSLLASQLSTSY